MKKNIPQTFKIARFALNTDYDNLPVETTDQLKKHLLDSVGSMIHAAGTPVIGKLSRQIKALSNGGKYNIPFLGKTSVDRGAQFYTALNRYPDFMDNFLGKEATCHPSDNIGALLAASQITNARGKDFLTAMAIGYEIECRLIEELPVMIEGFDHCLLLGISLTAALCKIFSLSEEATAHAIAIASSSITPLVSCRASYTYEWKGFLSSLVALNCMNTVLLAREGMTGPINLFEGPKGYKDAFDMELKYDWKKDKFQLIKKCILKSYNAEVHTQSLVEAALELRDQYKINAAEIDKIEATTFLTAYHIVGGGEYGDRTNVQSKEQADHSLPYVLAVSLLDGQLYPEQFLPKRIVKEDVQRLLKKVKVHTKFPLHKPVKVAGVLDPYTAAYPEKLMGKLVIRLKNGKEYSLEKEDYYGFFTRPISWEDVHKKFKKLTSKKMDISLQEAFIEKIMNLEKGNMRDLLFLLEKAAKQKRPGATQMNKYKKAS